MITANEARKYVENALEQERIQRQQIVNAKMREVENKIRITAERALFQVVIRDKVKFFGQQAIEDAVVKELRQNGFTVNNSTANVIISWILDKEST